MIDVDEYGRHAGSVRTTAGERIVAARFCAPALKCIAAAAVTAEVGESGKASTCRRLSTTTWRRGAVRVIDSNVNYAHTFLAAESALAWLVEPIVARLTIWT